MASLNRVMLIGRLTDAPEAPRTLPNSGATVVKFRFAVGRSKKDPNTGQWTSDPNPLYIDCEVFQRADATRRLADLVAQYAKKGSQLYVEGRLQLDQWDDKNGGGKRSKHKMVVESVEFLDRAQGGGGDGDESAGEGNTRGGFNRGGGRAPVGQAVGSGDEFGVGDPNDSIPF